MDPTMRRIAQGLKRLRREVGVTQQEVSDRAGEPCRTFLAHLEQGRKVNINLKKLYGVLHVLLGDGNDAVTDTEIVLVLEKLLARRRGP